MSNFTVGGTYKVTAVTIKKDGKRKDISSFAELQADAESVVMGAVDARIGLIGSEPIPGVGAIAKMTNGDIKCIMVGDGKKFECIISKRGSDKMNIAIKSITPHEA